MSVFVDTSVWYAALDRSDSSHQHARSLLETDEELVLSDHILVENWMLSAHRLGPEIADRYWATMIDSGVSLEFVSGDDLRLAFAIRRGWPDQRFSIVDCTSFVLMERLRLNRVTTFDQDFSIYRYGPQRRKAFEIIR